MNSSTKQRKAPLRWCIWTSDESWALRRAGLRLAMVQRSRAGFFWYTLGIEPLRNTADSPCDSLAAAKKEAEDYVKSITNQALGRAVTK